MITVSNFYQQYQIHHFRAKSILLKKMLDNRALFPAKEVIDEGWGFSDEDVVRFLKVEMRNNLFHAIETLFTLYFCLQPDKIGMVEDNALFQNLNKKQFYHRQIREIANGGLNSLDILDSTVKFGETDTQFGKYLFYFAIKPTAFKPGIEDCLKAIKMGLVGLANELADITEYNSYKHALRAMPAFTEVTFIQVDNPHKQISFDTSDSMTYLTDLKDNRYSYETRIFDTLRDFKMTQLCSNLIFNIIMYRRISISGKAPDPKGVIVAYYGKDQVEDCLKRNIDLAKFSQSFSKE